MGRKEFQYTGKIAGHSKMLAMLLTRAGNVGPVRENMAVQKNAQYVGSYATNA